MGGAGTYAENITQALSGIGHEVHVMIPLRRGYPKYELDNDVHIHRIPIIDRPLFRAPSFWLNLCKEYKIIAKNVGGFDITHSHLMSDILLNVFFRWETPRVITVHHLSVDALFTFKPSVFDRVKNIHGETGLSPIIEKMWLMNADRIIAVSKYAEDTLNKYYHLPSDNICLIYNGHNTRSFDFSSDEILEIKQRYNIEVNSKVILFVGRVADHRKGLDTLLKAFKNVVKLFDATLLIVGKGSQRNSKMIAESLKISDRVKFAGFVDDVTLSKCYLLADIYVVPSRLEGFGLTLLDAMAAGKPIVTTDVGAIPEIIKDGENGILVKPDKPDELAAAIIELLDNRLKSEQIGKNNKMAVSKYNWINNAKAVGAIYDELVNK